MDGVPLDAVALEVVLVEALVVVLAVQVGVEAVVEPPGAVEMLCAAVVVSTVVVAVLGAGINREQQLQGGRRLALSPIYCVAKHLFA